jgi:hypothetical protein
MNKFYSIPPSLSLSQCCEWTNKRKEHKRSMMHKWKTFVKVQFLNGLMDRNGFHLFSTWNEKQTVFFFWVKVSFKIRNRKNKKDENKNLEILNVLYIKFLVYFQHIGIVSDFFFFWELMRDRQRIEEEN